MEQNLQPGFIHKNLAFYESVDNFCIVPSESDTKEMLVINRHTNKITLENNKNLALNSFFVRNIHGIFGVIKLIAGNYLILITKITKVGEIFTDSIYRIDKVEIVEYNTSQMLLTDAQKQFNKQYFSMVEFILKCPNFYFSYTYDISYNLQKLIKSGYNFGNEGLFKRSNRYFVWNQHLMNDFANRKELSPFCIPIIHGFISINTSFINDKKFTWALISRRSMYRAGTRMFSRGIDENGNVSNFVETEQLFMYNDVVTSFVQIRGSIPVHWTQLPDLRYKPPPSVQKLPHLASYSKHIKEISKLYGKVCMINLIGHHGQEEILLKAFREVVNEANFLHNEIPYAHFECFDFHKECKNGQWHRLSLLMQQIDSFINEFGYLNVANGNGSVIVHSQNGVFRTNCIDSLDRTNVVQGLIARTVLERQLKRFEIIGNSQKISDFPEFEFVYRNVWADNADMCSVQYAGTGALKSDFTRTGKRRFMGKVMDGINSMIRYYKNNFEDGFRQDSIDLILGNYVVDEDEGKSLKCPLDKRNILKILTCPLLLAASILMFIFSMFLLPTEHMTEKLFYLLFWFAMSSTCFIIMLFLGKEFVDNPTLMAIKQK